MTSKAGEVISLEGFQVKVIRSVRRKTLSIELATNDIIARAPNRMSLRVIKQFVLLKQDWIEKHLANKSAAQPPLKLVSGAQLDLLGSIYNLNIHQGRGAITISQNTQIIAPIIESHLPLEQTVLRKLVKWYKQKAILELRIMACKHAALMFPNQKKLMKIGPNDINVRDYKRRWGSCNYRGELAFNWRIIMAPREVCEYVVVHELAHRKEFNHSPQFWHIVKQQAPNWQESRNWLAKHGSRLYRF